MTLTFDALLFDKSIFYIFMVLSVSVYPTIRTSHFGYLCKKLIKVSNLGKAVTLIVLISDG